MLKDKKEIDKQNRNRKKSKIATLIHDRTILLIMCGLLMLTCIWCVYYSANAARQARKTHEIVWVKLSPDGKYSISSFSPSNEQPLFKTTVNSLLTHFIEARYQLHSETIKHDYAEATTFMSESLYTNFISPQGFDAPNVAANIMAKPNSYDRIDIENISLDHYDQIDGSFSGKKKPVIRTSISFVEKHYRAGGTIDEQKRNLRITWTLLSRDSLSQKTQGWLNVNPLGITILSQHDLD